MTTSLLSLIFWSSRPITTMAKKSNHSVPLLCSLCPNSPRFSDISHLLTHISSKSHLAHRFNLQIRGPGEPEAQQQLDDFETWYAENGIGDMLSERLAAKDHKNTSKRVRNSVANVSHTRTASHRTKIRGGTCGWLCLLLCCLHLTDT